MNAREVIELVTDDTVAHLVPDWHWPDDYYPVIVWHEGDVYAMQCHDDPDPIVGDKDLMIINMVSYNGDWKAVPAGTVWQQEE